MYKETFEIFRDVVLSNRVQFLSDIENIKSYKDIDFNFRDTVFVNFDYDKMINKIKSLLDTYNIYEYKDEFNISYIFLKTNIDNIHQYHVIGPYIYENITQNNFHNILLANKLPENKKLDLDAYYNRIPLIKSYMSWRETLNVFFKRFYGDDIHINDINYYSFNVFENTTDSYIVSPETSTVFETVMKRYETEENMLNAIEKGDTNKALYYHNMFRNHKLTSRAELPIRNQKNVALAVNTAIRKTVQRASIHPFHIDQISTKVAIEVENAQSKYEIDVVFKSMIRKYCILVSTLSRGKYSQTIKICLDYIDFNYYDDISLEFFANYCTVSKGYLSTLFKKEVGTNITDYINSVRIKHAVLLLNTTDLSVSVVAQKCGYSDGNYFTRRFKKIHNISPKEYRKLTKTHI